MLKRLAPFAALLVALAAIVPTPPAHAADRTYTLCDPMTAKLCASLVALYEFEEPTNSARTSETGSAPFLEVSGANVPTAAGKIGSYCLDPDASTGARRVYIPRSASLGGEFTINMWLYIESTTATDSSILSTTDAASAQVGSRLYLTGATNARKLRFAVKEAVTDEVTYAEVDVTDNQGAWHYFSFGEYPTPTTSEPYQMTLWISKDAAARSTATATYPPQVFLGTLVLGDMAINAGNYRFDQLSVFSGTLSAGEVTWLYNSGSGRAYPFTANP